MSILFNHYFFFQIPDQDAARRAKPGQPFTFTVDASKTGWGEVAIDVVYDNKSIRRTFYIEEIRERVSFFIIQREKGDIGLFITLVPIVL